MKIHEENFLWKCYVRSFGDRPVQHPGSLCRFFWRAMDGLYAKVTEDANFWLIYPWVVGLAVGSAALLGTLVHELPDRGSLLLVLYSPVLVVLWRPAIVMPLARCARWIQTRNWWNATLMSNIRVTIAVVVCVVGFILLSDNWWSLLCMVLLVLAPFALLLVCRLGYQALVHPLSITEAGKTLLAFFKASKERVCPLVEPPDSWSRHTTPDVPGAG